jgi:hypothetical protein
MTITLNTVRPIIGMTIRQNRNESFMMGQAKNKQCCTE